MGPGLRSALHAGAGACMSSVRVVGSHGMLAGQCGWARCISSTLERWSKCVRTGSFQTLHGRAKSIHHKYSGLIITLCIKPLPE